MKVLIVEDHEEMWDFLCRRLRRHGFDVAVATDGREGIAMSKSEAPDIVLLDMNLPDVDGWRAARVMRADPMTAGLPIIAMTAHAVSGDREKAMAAGCTEYCPKPIDFSDLLAKIDRLTEPRRNDDVEPLDVPVAVTARREAK